MSKTTLDSYLEFTNSVALYPGSGEGGALEIDYLVLGVVGELNEAMGVYFNGKKEGSECAKEMGDTLWYLIRLYSACTTEESVQGIHDGGTSGGMYNSISTHEFAISSVMNSSSTIAGILKKHKRGDEKYSDFSEMKNRLSHYCEMLYGGLTFLIINGMEMLFRWEPSQKSILKQWASLIL